MLKPFNDRPAIHCFTRSLKVYALTLLQTFIPRKEECSKGLPEDDTSAQSQLSGLSSTVTLMLSG